MFSKRNEVVQSRITLQVKYFSDSILFIFFSGKLIFNIIRSALQIYFVLEKLLKQVVLIVSVF